MPVGYESQVFAMCDMCGYEEFSSMHTLAEFKKLMRIYGWTIGKKVICPECNAKRRSNDHADSNHA